MSAIHTYQTIGRVPRNELHSRCPADDWLDRFFESERPEISFREIYTSITGDKRATGRLDDCSSLLMREALASTSWTNVLGNAITRRMLADYKRGEGWNVWRKVVKIGRDINDFRSQIRAQFGGYGDLPIVAQGNPYTALPSPPEESASYSVQKRGGTEQITLEAIKNDNVSAIHRIPKRLADAANRTLSHFVLDFFRTNPVIYDGVALFHATHGNLGSAALSASALAAARSAMMKQTELGSGDRLGTQPKYLLVPMDIEETGVNLFRRGTNNDKTFVQDMPIEILPAWYWTDTDDWCVAADPRELASIEIGFLDGEEDPKLVIADAPTGGSMFTNDQITMKILHIYGGAVIDYRGLYKSVV